MIRVYQTRAMYPQEAMRFQESFKEFERMRNHFRFTILHIQNAIIDAPFQQNHIRNQYLFQGFMIENQEGIVSFGLISFHRGMGLLIIVQFQ